MSMEIERKYLVKSDSWLNSDNKKVHISQGYLANTERGSIRVRLAENKASLNIKSMTLGVTRTEYDYPIPADKARSFLDNLCMQPLIEKTQYYLEHNEHFCEIDD